MSIYKACDIRGRYPDQINARECFAIGRALAALAREQASAPSPGRFLVAGDVRTSTPELKQALIGGLACGGAAITDLGTVPTPAAYFQLHCSDAEHLVVVTASHNPPADNGVKFMLHRRPVSEAQMADLLRHVTRLRAQAPGPESAATAVERASPIAGYIDFLVGRFAPRTRRALRVALDPGHGCMSGIAVDVCRRLGHEARAIFDQPDGTFPGRPPDCSQAGHLRDLRGLVRDWRADIGLAFDGDGDRLAVLDERGEVVRPEALAVLLLRHLVPAGANERMVYDIKCSQQLARMAAKHGCTPLIERSGHAYIKQRMLEEQALLGCEVSGHYFFRELHGGDDGLFAALLTLELLAASGAPVSQLVAVAMPAPHITPDIRVPLDELEADTVFEALRRHLPPERLSELDGLRISWDDGWALLRRSVTEPVLTLRLEGEDRQALHRVAERFLELAPWFAAPLRSVLSQQP